MSASMGRKDTRGLKSIQQSETAEKRIRKLCRKSGLDGDIQYRLYQDDIYLLLKDRKKRETK